LFHQTLCNECLGHVDELGKRRRRNKVEFCRAGAQIDVVSGLGPFAEDERPGGSDQAEVTRRKRPSGSDAGNELRAAKYGLNDVIGVGGRCLSPCLVGTDGSVLIR
jgi:hypothetical protein